MEMKKILLSATILGLGLSTFAADGEKAEKAEKTPAVYKTTAVTVGLGTAIGFTDVKQYQKWPVFTYQNELGFSGYVGVEKYISSIFGFQGQLAYSQVKGTDRTLKIVSNANTIETGVNAIVNISNLGFSGKIAQRKTIVYLTGGIGVGFFRSSLASIFDTDQLMGTGTKDSKGNATYQNGAPGYVNVKTGEEKKKTVESYIPIGGGVRYKLNNSIDLGIEMTARVYDTDKLDAMRFQGANDKYLMTVVTGTYKIGKQEEALVWANPFNNLLSDVLENKKKIGSMSSDSDNDGVADMFDKEAGTAEGALVDGSGKTLDLKDNSEEVKTLTARVAALEGQEGPTTVAGVPTKSSSAAFSGYLPSVYFSSNSARVDAKGQVVIAEIAKSIKGAKSVTILGNTDKSGTDSYNQKLGERRAQAVQNILVSTYGFNKSIFKIESKGEVTPIGSASFANRRVDVIIK